MMLIGKKYKFKVLETKKKKMKINENYSYRKFGNNILVNIHYFLRLSNINICQLIIYIVIIS